MTKRRARFRRSRATGKTVKLKEVDRTFRKRRMLLFINKPTMPRRLLVALILLSAGLIIATALCHHQVEASNNRANNTAGKLRNHLLQDEVATINAPARRAVTRTTRTATSRQSRRLSGFHEAGPAFAASSSLGSVSSRSSAAGSAGDTDSSGGGDPMEPCYLANNRASETLTISESTPVGTIVGELMVNGDSSEDGNIELSIKMPSGNGAISSQEDNTSSPNDNLSSSATSASQQKKQPTNGYHLLVDEVSNRRLGSLPDSSYVGADGIIMTNTNTSKALKARHMTGPKSSRDLSYLIDLMPPLSIEQGTKRLILAKKLDRENLDKYMGSYQSSMNSPSLSSSASLTVHIKCQLRDKNLKAVQSNGTTTAAAAAAAISADEQVKSSRKTTPRKSSTNSILIPIHLIVTDENDNWPNFIGWPYIIDLNETAPVGSLLQGNEIVAIDNDQQGPLSTIEYSIVPGSFWSDSFGFLNPLDSRSLIVRDNRYFDYESQSKLTLKVMARDQGEPPNWAITSLYINLLDQDDLNPVFSDDKYFGFVTDNRPGEKIALLPKRLVAHDGDRTLSTPISYSFHIKTNHSIHFDLDSDLGQLTLKKTLPEAPHTRQSFCLLVKATQVDNPSRSTLTAINLKLSGSSMIRSIDHSSNSTSNEQAPKFSHSNYTIEVSEAALVGSTILTASASSDSDDAVTYELLDNDLGYLSIDKTSGRLTLNKSLDYEMFSHLTVRMLATSVLVSNDDATEGSSAYPKLACDIARVNIHVISHNDYSPEFSHEQYNFQLAISDLIANFEPASARLRAEDDGSTLNAADKMSHRLGEIELEDSVDELDYRAIQLGQVYCSDRDHGDKVSLRLSGSKASLFHLTQDGRLYLPLINVSSIDEPQQSQISRDIHQHQLKWGSSKSANRIINNQFSMSRIFASVRRSGNQQSDALDRSYLNYLLNELGNLGRLRLKVYATDSGQPETRESTALIVVSIISIDNFIIQRAPFSHQSGIFSSSHHNTEFIKTTNGTSSGFVRKNDASGRDASSEKYSSHMMIPSVNGKDFVHIKPDIIGNLLLPSQNYTLSSSRAGVRDRLESQLPDTLESAASNIVSSTLNPSTGQLQLGSGKQQPQHQQPPSLLLIDDDGAKFVAMPAAIEVYNQQVQEAANQQARQKLRHDQDMSRESTTSSFWIDKLGLSYESWPGISATILLHIVVILFIIGLVTRMRVYAQSGEQQTSSTRFNPDCDDAPGWPRRISRFGSLFASKPGGSSASDILNQHQASSVYGNVSSSLSVNRSDLHQHHSYSDHAQERIGPDSARHQQIGGADHVSTTQQQAVVSSGTVVSAMSNVPNHHRHHVTRQQGNCDNNNDRLAEISPEAKNQQNLFDHLKLTLNKMMDNSNDGAHDSQQQSGHISVRPLDSDVVAFEDQRDRQLDDQARYRETSELLTVQKSQQQQQQQHEKSSISTFVGTGNHGSQQRSPAQQASTSENSTSTEAARRLGKPISTVINIVAPKQFAPDCCATRNSPKKSDDYQSAQQPPPPPPASTATKTTKSQHRNSSSSSSVISLGSSVASSLSNKISEAIVKASNGDQITGSDASSLNSSILLHGCAGGETFSSSLYGKQEQQADYTRHRLTHTSAKTPPVPPPLPPPPSLVRVCARENSNHSLSSASHSPRHANGPQADVDIYGHVVTTNESAVSNVRRQRLPENPVYSKLRRETISTDQMASNHAGRNQSNRSSQSQQVSAHQELTRSIVTKPLVSVDHGQQQQQQQQSQLVIGRRETRNQLANHVRAQASSPMLMPAACSQQQPCDSSQLDASKSRSAIATTNKTVSPTTSVDRGYESFQSCDQSRTARQFSSLQDYEPDIAYATAQDAQQFVISLPASGTRVTPKNIRSNNNQSKQLTRIKPTNTSCRAGQAAQVPTHSSKHITTQTLKSSALDRARTSGVARERLNQSGEADCDAEDDDFYYCCGDLSHTDNTHHHISVGGLLSDYASHTYKQQQHQQQHQQTPTMSASPTYVTTKQRNATIGPTGGRLVNNYSHRQLKYATSSNDLIQYTCEYEQSQACDMTEQQLQKRPARYLYNDRVQTHRRGSSQQISSSSMSAALGRTQRTVRQKRVATNGGVNYPSQTMIMSDGYNLAGSSKKQLTWSDQVEMDSY